MQLIVLVIETIEETITWNEFVHVRN